MCPIRITLTDDHPLVLAGMKALLQDVQDIEIVGKQRMDRPPSISFARPRRTLPSGHFTARYQWP